MSIIKGGKTYGVETKIISEDTLQQYLDGTLVGEDGVLDLRNYTELPSYFLENEKYNNKVKQILWNDNTKIIPSKFMNNNSLEVFTLPKNVEHIGGYAQLMENRMFKHLRFLIH